MNSPAPRHPIWNVNTLTGVFAAALGAVGLAVVLCFRYPAWLTTPELRALLPLAWVRLVTQGVLVAAFALGVANVLRHRRRALGLLGLALVTLAFALGGETGDPHAGAPLLGLDWFLLDLTVTAVIFVPLERAFALRGEQPIFRPGFRTDLAHFFVSHVSVQVMTFAAMLPATIALRYTGSAGWQAAVAAQPLFVQFLEIMLVADLCEYWIHRAFHRVPWLWRFHAVHHSSERMDWIAGSRIHVAEALVMRALTYVPIHWLGFEMSAVYGYLIFVSFHAMLIHANVRWRFAPVAALLVTPKYHHWHHAAEAAAVDKNFALHFPWLDRLFGTHYDPPRWPEAYGVAGFPRLGNYFAHLAYPFRRRQAAPGEVVSPG